MPLHDVSNIDPEPYYPGYEIGYDQITTNVSVTGTAEASGTTIIACAAHTFDGLPVMAEFFSPEVVSNNTASTDILVISLFEGATEIGEFGQVRTVAVGSTRYVGPFFGRYRFTPTAGSHTYTVTAYVTNTASGATVAAGTAGTTAFVPAFCRFTKV